MFTTRFEAWVRRHAEALVTALGRSPLTPNQVTVVGVDVADPRSSATAFVRRLGVNYLLLDDHDGAVAAKYRVAALPMTFVIASNGTILARHPGALTEPELSAVLQIDFSSLSS